VEKPHTHYMVVGTGSGIFVPMLNKCPDKGDDYVKK